MRTVKIGDQFLDLLGTLIAMQVHLHDDHRGVAAARLLLTIALGAFFLQKTQSHQGVDQRRG